MIDITFIQNRIKMLRQKHNITQHDLANAINITSQSIMNYETGKRIIPLETLDKIATYFNVSILSFFNEPVPSFIRNDRVKQIPIVRTVAENGRYDEMSISDWIEMPKLLCKNADFILFVKDESLEPYINNWDLAFIKRDVVPDNGDIALFYLNDELLIRILHYHPLEKVYTLKSHNPQYPPITIDKSDNFKIIGKVVATFSLT